MNNHSRNVNRLVELTCGNYLCAVVWLQFGDDCVLEFVCCSGIVQEKRKYGSKGALLPAYHTTSTKESTMADQLMDLLDIFQSSEDTPVNKQVSLFLELTNKAKGTGSCSQDLVDMQRIDKTHSKKSLSTVNFHHMFVAYLLLSSLLQWWMAG